MGKKDFHTEFDELLRAAMQTEDQPPVQLNNKLKAEIYEQERLLRRSRAGRRISLWYLPMVLNLIIFSLLGTAAVLLANNLYVAVLAAAGCAYMGLAGVVITAVGMRRTDLKEDTTICIEKGGAGI